MTWNRKVWIRSLLSYHTHSAPSGYQQFFCALTLQWPHCLSSCVLLLSSHLLLFQAQHYLGSSSQFHRSVKHHEQRTNHSQFLAPWQSKQFRIDQLHWEESICQHSGQRAACRNDDLLNSKLWPWRIKHIYCSCQADSLVFTSQAVCSVTTVSATQGTSHGLLFLRLFVHNRQIQHWSQIN